MRMPFFRRPEASQTTESPPPRETSTVEDPHRLMALAVWTLLAGPVITPPDLSYVKKIMTAHPSHTTQRTR